MRAVRQHALGGPDVLVLEDLPRPDPGPTEVLVRVAAAGVNPVDWKVRTRGGIPAELPFTVGWDVAGVVEEVGVGVTWLSPGDRVFGMPRFPREAACYAEYVSSPSRHLARTPEGVVRRRGGRRPARRADGVAGARRHLRCGRGVARARARRGRRGRAPGGADREGARRVGRRDVERREARLPARARGRRAAGQERRAGGRGGRRARRGRRRRRARGGAGAARRRDARHALHVVPSRRCERPPPGECASPGSSSSRTGSA